MLSDAFLPVARVFMTSESNHVAPKWKNAVALAILCAYILLMVFKSVRAPVPATMLPAKLRDFLVFTTAELALFGAFWLISWCFSRADADELLLRWRGGWQPIWKGLLYSLALRMVPVLFFVWLFAIAVLCGVKLDSIEHLVARYGPTNERVISSVALADPLYRLILMTWGSFVVAGFREELWRTAMLAISTRLLQPALSQRSSVAALCSSIAAWSRSR